MPTSVRDLVSAEELGLELLVDGDLDRSIRWVHVTELADASPYLVGDEFVLTAGVWRGRRHSAQGFVDALRTRRVAGIGYGLLEGDTGVPAAVQKACRDAAVPLVAVPVRTPFVAISQWFVERLTADREHDLRITVELTADLLGAAEAASPDDALAEVTRLLARSTGSPVWIATARGVARAAEGDVPASADQRRIVAAARAGISQVDGWTLQPIGVGAGQVWVAVRSTVLDRLDLRARIDTARPVVGLILARESAVRESERRLAGEIVSLILGRQVEVAAARMPYYGLDPEAPSVAVVCAVGERDQALTAAEEWLSVTGNTGVVALRADELMLVIDAEGLADTASAHRVATDFARWVGATAGGTGAIAPTAMSLRRSLVQARQACTLARRRGGGAVVSHDAAGSHSMLLALQDQDVLDSFRESLLAPLESYDVDHGGVLVTTLRTFLDTGGRWQETATALHIHVNTLRHRLDRVEQLTGRQLDTTPDRVDLWLALQASQAGVATPDAD